MQKLTEAQYRALKWLKDQGGIGIVDTHGRVVARGEVARGVLADTWLRLFTYNDLVSEGPHKFKISSVGLADLDIATNTTHRKLYNRTTSDDPIAR